MNGKEIEFETVTLKVPKKVMEFLRECKALGSTPKEYLERSIVEDVRSGIEAEEYTPTPKQLADNLELNSIFKALVEDEVL